MNFLLKTICIVVIMACLLLIFQGKLLFASAIALLPSGALLLYLFKEDQFYTKLSNRRKNKFDCQVAQDHFYFPNGYYFRHSSMKGSKKLPFAKVDKLITNTTPISALVNGNELLFLKGLGKDDVTSLADRFEERPDIWAMLCEEFLDTELTEWERKANVEALARNGIPEQEQKLIRQKLKNRLLFRTWITAEWMYVGQFEVLTELWPLTRKKYWWTMEIALRDKII